MDRKVLRTVSLVAVLVPAVIGFVIPGTSSVQVTSQARVVLRPILSRPGHRFTGRWRPLGSPLFSSDDSTSGMDDGGNQPPPPADEGATVQQEMENIQDVRMTAKQMKAELDSRGISYTGLLEKAEFVRALAEARVSGPGESPVGDDMGSDSEAAPEASPFPEPEVQEVYEDPVIPVEDTENVGGDDSEGETLTTEDSVSSPDIEKESSDEDFSVNGGSASDTRSTSQDVGSTGDSTSEESSDDETGDRTEPCLEQPIPQKENETILEEEESILKDEESVHSSTQEDDDIASPAKSSEPPLTETDSSSTSQQNSSQGEPSEPEETTSLGAVEDEVSKILESRMTAKQIKAELDSLGISYRGLLEKSEFIRRLAEARANSDQFEEQRRDVDNVAESGQGSEDGVEPSGESGATVEEEGPVGTDEEPPVQREEPTVASEDPAAAMDEHAESSAEENSSIREEVRAMRISQMKKELDERGVSYRGLLEKAEFVDLLVDARVRGITAPTGGGEGGADGGDSTDAGPKKGEYDPSYKDVKMKKMKDETASKQEEQSGTRGGAAGGGAGGFDIGSILSGLGGMAGAGGGGGAGGAGGFDIGSILSGLGGMGGAGGGAPGSGMPGAGGIGDMLGKVMNDPKAMAAFQKAQQNPKVMTALQDISQNGLGAAAKYRDDPEIGDVIEDLKSLF